jgi:CubicO group peptidase (beta-lactamase class C family)
MARKSLWLVVGLVVVATVTAGVIAKELMHEPAEAATFIPASGPEHAIEVPGPHWKKAVRPSDVGWSEEALDGAWQFARQIGSGAIVVVQHGVIVATWGNVTEPYDIYSVRKSLLHALIGPLVESGTLDLDATLAELGIDDKGGLTAAEREARVRDLLSSRSGVYHPAAYEARDNAALRPSRGSHRHGEYFYYNNWDFNALGTIYERVSKGHIFEDFQARIAVPLQMEDFSLGYTEYVRERASDHPAYVFRMTARDLARFGLLYLRDGRWADRQIVPEAWIKTSIRSYTRGAQPFSDYGYLWWVYPEWPTLYGASGNGNQKVLVWPSRDIVVVHLAPTKTWGLFGREVGSVDFWKLMSKISAAAPRP